MSLDINSLRQMIAQDAAAVSQLKQLLVDERNLLEQRKLDELQHIVDQKIVLVDQLNTNAKLRQQILNTLGLPANANGWDLFLQRNVATLPLRDEWKIVVSEFEDCKEMNEINGRLVGRSQQTLNHLLALLRGKGTAPSLYNAQGAKTEYTSSYTVAEA